MTPWGGGGGGGKRGGSEKAMIGVVDGRLIFNREWRSIIRVEFCVKT